MFALEGSDRWGEEWADQARQQEVLSKEGKKVVRNPTFLPNPIPEQGGIQQDPRLSPS